MRTDPSRGARRAAAGALLLLATVAGLAVAIPALFAYNWLLARIKNVTATMQVFADELVTAVAEQASQAHAAGAPAALVVAEEVAS